MILIKFNHQYSRTKFSVEQLEGQPNISDLEKPKENLSMNDKTIRDKQVFK